MPRKKRITRWLPRIVVATSGLLALTTTILWIAAQFRTIEVTAKRQTENHPSPFDTSIGLTIVSDGIGGIVMRDRAQILDATPSGFGQHTWSYDSTISTPAALTGQASFWNLVWPAWLDHGTGNLPQRQLPSDPSVRVNVSTSTTTGGVAWYALTTAAALPWLIHLPFKPAVRRRIRASRGLCTECAYNRQGLAKAAPCPECGHTPSP